MTSPYIIPRKVDFDCVFALTVMDKVLQNHSGTGTAGKSVLFDYKKSFPTLQFFRLEKSLLFGVPSVLHIEISVPHISFDFFEPQSSDCDVIFWIPKM